VRDCLMEAAALLVADAADTDAPTAAAFRPLVLDVLGAFVEGLLARAASSVAPATGSDGGEEEEEEEEEEDGLDESVEEARLETAASLFRFAAAVGAPGAVSSLAALLSQAVGGLFGAPPADGAALAAAQERVTVLVGLGAAVLADAGRGETPSVPPAFLPLPPPPVGARGKTTATDAPTAAAAAAALFAALVDAVRGEAAAAAARGVHAAEVSPRVAAAALSATARVARTYLLGGAAGTGGGGGGSSAPPRQRPSARRSRP